MDWLTEEQSKFLKELKDNPECSQKRLSDKEIDIVDELIRRKYVECVDWEEEYVDPIIGSRSIPVIYRISQAGKAYLRSEEIEKDQIAAARKEARDAKIVAWIALAFSVITWLWDHR